MRSATLGGKLLTTLGALRRYFQIIVTLLRREEENRRRTPMESIVALMEPIIMVGVLTFLWWFLGRRGFVIVGGAPILFYATGFFVIYFFIYISRKMRGATKAPGRRYPIEQRLDRIVVHLILRIIDYSILGVLAFSGLYIFVTPDAIPHDIVPIAKACVAIVALGFGWGMVDLVISPQFKLWAYICPALNRSLILISGAMFIPDFLSPSVRYVLSLNPIMHVVVMFRQGFYPGYPSLLLDTTYLAWCSLGAVVLGLVLERASRRAEQL